MGIPPSERRFSESARQSALEIYGDGETADRLAERDDEVGAVFQAIREAAMEAKEVDE